MSGIEFDGLDDVVESFTDAAKRIQPELRKVVYRGGMNVKREARANGPRYVPGGQRIDMAVTVDADEIRADIESQSPLATVIEYGSPTLPGGRPFMGPALETEREPFPDAVDDLVDRLTS